MIYTFRLVSDEVDNFMREIKIDADASFLILRNAILDSVGYDKSQLSSFFICDNNWEKEQEITLEDMNIDADKDFYLMDETPLTDFIEDEGQRLIFTFDYLTDRSFFIELKATEPGSHLMDPVVSRSEGNPPAEHTDLKSFADLSDKADKKTAAPIDDMDEDFYGSTDYNDDELDISAIESFDPTEDM